MTVYLYFHCLGYTVYCITCHIKLSSYGGIYNYICVEWQCLTSASWKRADCPHGFPSGVTERDDCEHTVS